MPKMVFANEAKSSMHFIFNLDYIIKCDTFIFEFKFKKIVIF